MAVLSDNSRFVSCGEDKAAFLWDVSTGAVVRRMQGHEQRINACCFSSDGSVLFTGSYDKVGPNACLRPPRTRCNGAVCLGVFFLPRVQCEGLLFRFRVFYHTSTKKCYRMSLPASC